MISEHFCLQTRFKLWQLWEYLYEILLKSYGAAEKHEISYFHIAHWDLNTLGPNQHGRHFVDEILQMHFLEWKCIIPGVTLCFVPVRTPPPVADFCTRENFWKTFWNSFNFGTIVGPDLIDYLIRFWSIFVVTLALDFSRSNMEFALSQKWSDCHQTYRLNPMPQMWPSGWFDLGHDFDLEFSRSNVVRLPRNEQQT